MDRDTLLQEIKLRLQTAHGERLKGVVLYGSVTRGEESEDRDVDVLVLLTGPIRLGTDLEKHIAALYDLSLDIERWISAIPVDVEAFQESDYPLIINAKREGMRV